MMNFMDTCSTYFSFDFESASLSVFPMTRVPKSIKSTRQILKGPNHILHSLYAQSRELASVLEVVKHFTGEEVAIFPIKNNELTICATSGASATRLRYRQRNIIASLKRAGLKVSSLKIKVQPVLPETGNPEVHRHLSRQSAEHLAKTAAYIEDKSLSEALTRLSKRTD
jgi:hypothetical protein